MESDLFVVVLLPSFLACSVAAAAPTAETRSATSACSSYIKTIALCKERYPSDRVCTAAFTFGSLAFMGAGEGGAESIAAPDAFISLRSAAASDSAHLALSSAAVAATIALSTVDLRVVNAFDILSSCCDVRSTPESRSSTLLFRPSIASVASSSSSKLCSTTSKPSFKTRTSEAAVSAASVAAPAYIKAARASAAAFTPFSRRNSFSVSCSHVCAFAAVIFSSI